MLGIQRPSRWVPVVVMLVWAGVIFYLSSRSHVAVTDDPLWDLLTRKAAHVLVFGVLAYLAATVAKAFGAPSPVVIGFVVSVVYGTVDELHQSFVVGRSAQATDVLVDATGALLGVTIWWWRNQRHVVTR